MKKGEQRDKEKKTISLPVGGMSMEERYLFKAKREDNKEWIFGSYAYAFVPDEKSHIYGLTRENHVIVKKTGI